MKNIILTNAFSINMLNDSISATFTKLDVADVPGLLGHDWVSAVGHPDTAELFGSVLGTPVPCNRVTVEFDRDTTLVVGQYKGPRLPEGCHILPEGATIEWWMVRPIDWDEVKDYYEGRV